MNLGRLHAARTSASSCSGPSSPWHSRRTPFGSTRLTPEGAVYASLTFGLALQPIKYHAGV